MAKKVRPRPYLSFSQLNTWERGEDLYRRMYLLGETPPNNANIHFGKELHECIEQDRPHIDPVIEHARTYFPRYEKQEFVLDTKCEVCPLKAVLDGFDESTLGIGEYKTGVNWTQGSVDKNLQLTFYAYCVYLKYGKMPSFIRLSWLNTVTLEMKTFETSRRMEDFIQLHGRISKAWDGIGRLCEREYAKI